MKRTHISSRGILQLRPHTEQGPDITQGVYAKPRGLWYGVDGDWARWVLAEMPHWFNGWVYDVDVSRANILYISTLAELDRFNAKYSTAWKLGLLDMPMIDWRPVAAEYDGIEIAPYQYERGLAGGFHWYYGWDCASGVVWNTRDITVKPKGTVVYAEFGEDEKFSAKGGIDCIAG